MNLTELFYGTFVPPPVTKTRRHNFGLTGGSGYVPPKPKLSERKDLTAEQKLLGSYKKIFAVLKNQKKPMCSAEMEKKVPWTRNHCSIIMLGLWKRGMATRFKVIRNGTAVYMYSAKIEGSNKCKSCGCQLADYQDDYCNRCQER